MNYTKSNSYTEHAGTGQRMHDAGKAIPTQVSDSDLNMIIWSLMEVVKSAGLQGVDFSADNPDSYKLLLRAIQQRAPLSRPVFAKEDNNLEGGQIYLQAADKQAYKDLAIDYQGSLVRFFATRKADNKTVGAQIDLSRISEGIIGILDEATQQRMGMMSATDKRTLDWLVGTIVPEVAAPSLVAFFARRSAPQGWLPANGAAISRTAYANLFAAIGTLFGAGDGSTTFNVPDLRGLFVRGWDGGRGIDVGRVFGSRQEDAIRNIIGSVSGAGYLGLFDAGSGAFRTTQGAKHINVTTGGDAYYNDFDFDASRVVPTAAETRPRNVALLPCIKY